MGDIAPGPGGAVGRDGDAMILSRRHIDDALASKGVDLLRLPLVLLVAVSAGAYHSLALTGDGAVFTWGQGGFGCLGHGEDLSNQLLPKKIEARDASGGDEP